MKHVIDLTKIKLILCYVELVACFIAKECHVGFVPERLFNRALSLRFAVASSFVCCILLFCQVKLMHFPTRGPATHPPTHAARSRTQRCPTTRSTCSGQCLPRWRPSARCRRNPRRAWTRSCSWERHLQLPPPRRAHQTGWRCPRPESRSTPCRKKPSWRRSTRPSVRVPPLLRLPTHCVSCPLQLRAVFHVVCRRAFAHTRNQ